MPKLGNRLDVISESVTLKLNSLVKKMKASGEDVINLTAGEPDFLVHPSLNEKIKEALSAGKSKYTPVPGETEVREAIALKTNQQQLDLKKPWKAENVIVSNGGKHSLYQVFQAILNPGDEVVMMSPYWLSYPEMVKLGEGTPVIVETKPSDQFVATPEALEAALSPRTKAVILNSPSNPSGAVYTKSQFKQLAAVLERFPDVWVISDEIYDQIVFNDEGFCSFLSAVPEFQERTITVNGMSKSCAMTGWRVGWTVGPVELIGALTRLQGQSTSGINALAQAATLAGLALPQEYFSQLKNTYQKRRDLMLECLEKSGKIERVVPQGAFYAFVGIQSVLGSQETAVDFAENLLKEQKVAVVPGDPFGAPHFVRLSFATDEGSIQEGCRRIVSYMENKKNS